LRQFFAFFCVLCLCPPACNASTSIHSSHLLSNSNASFKIHAIKSHGFRLISVFTYEHTFIQRKTAATNDLTPLIHAIKFISSWLQRAVKLQAWNPVPCSLFSIRSSAPPPPPRPSLVHSLWSIKPRISWNVLVKFYINSHTYTSPFVL
jgi:hypothetical protein